LDKEFLDAQESLLLVSGFDEHDIPAVSVSRLVGGIAAIGVVVGGIVVSGIVVSGIVVGGTAQISYTPIKNTAPPFRVSRKRHATVRSLNLTLELTRPSDD